MYEIVCRQALAVGFARLRHHVITREDSVLDFAIDLESIAVSEGKTDAIRRRIERAIIEERLKPGDTLPTVRALADDLGINKNTVAAAYRQLRESGLISAEGRKGSAVARHALLAASREIDAGAMQTMAVRDGNPDPLFLPDEGEIRDALGRISVAHHLASLNGRTPSLSTTGSMRAAAFSFPLARLMRSSERSPWRGCIQVTPLQLRTLGT
jgi:transposase-like protein